MNVAAVERHCREGFAMDNYEGFTWEPTETKPESPEAESSGVTDATPVLYRLARSVRDAAFAAVSRVRRNRHP